MNYKRQFDLDYKDLQSGENLYETASADTMIVDAEYRKVPGHLGNPDICCLPLIPDMEDWYYAQQYIPEILKEDTSGKSKSVRMDKANALRQARIPLIFQHSVNHAIAEMLTYSYSIRDMCLSRRESIFSINGHSTKQNVICVVHEMNGTPLTQSICGMSGTGKTVSVGMAIRNYYKGYRHKFPEEHIEYVQIPIICVTAYASGSIMALFMDFAKKLDIYLDLGSYHADQLKRHSGPAKAISVIAGWIRLYHIGLLIIDEIQFIELDNKRINSLETIITLLQETGISLLVIGNEDAVDSWTQSLRTYRRLYGQPFNTSLQCGNREYMENVIEELWAYTIFAEEEKGKSPDPEIIECIYRETMGSIDFISLLLVAAQFEMIQFPKEKLSTDFILGIVKRKFLSLKKLIHRNQVSDEKQYKELVSAYSEFYQSARNEEHQAESQRILDERRNDRKRGYDHVSRLLLVKDRILDNTDLYTEKEIISAFSNMEKTVDNFKSLTLRETVRLVRKNLDERRKKRLCKKKMERAKAEEYFEMLDDELKQDMR